MPELDWHETVVKYTLECRNKQTLEKDALAPATAFKIFFARIDL